MKIQISNYCISSCVEENDKKVMKSLEKAADNKVDLCILPYYLYYEKDQIKIEKIKKILNNYDSFSIIFGAFDGNQQKVYAYQNGEILENNLWINNQKIKITDRKEKSTKDVLIVQLANDFYQQKEGKIEENYIYVNTLKIENQLKSVKIYNGQIMAKYDEYQVNHTSLEDVDLLIDHSITKKVNLFDHLCFGVQQFDKRVFGGKINWVIGLSGGIDSSINAAILARSLGVERIRAYNLASKYNTQKTKDSANHTAKALEIPCAFGSIELLNDATLQTLEQFNYKNYPSLALENIQARLRGHLLSTFASLEKAVVVNNGNKVEIALGYATLHGDAIGALSILGDVTKEQEFLLANQINEFFGKEVIYQGLIPSVENNQINWDLPPSAELATNQKDPMKWFYHDYLIANRHRFSLLDLMNHFLNNTIHTLPFYNWMCYYQVDKKENFIEDLTWLYENMHRNRFKSIQSMPMLVVSDSSFSEEVIDQLQLKDSQFYELKAKILCM